MIEYFAKRCCKEVEGLKYEQSYEDTLSMIMKFFIEMLSRLFNYTFAGLDIDPFLGNKCDL